MLILMLMSVLMLVLMFAFCSEDGTIRVVAVVGLGAVRTVRAHEGQVKALAFDPLRQVLASVGSDGLVRIWDTQDYTLLASQPLVPKINYTYDNTTQYNPMHYNAMQCTTIHCNTLGPSLETLQPSINALEPSIDTLLTHTHTLSLSL